MEDCNLIHVLILWIPEYHNMCAPGWQDPNTQEFLSSGRGTESPPFYHSERVATAWNFQRRQIAHPTLHRAAQSWAPAVSQWYQQSPKAKGHIPMGFTALFIYPNNWKNLLPLGLKAMQQMGFSWAGKWATMPSLSESSLTRTWEQNRAQD